MAPLAAVAAAMVVRRRDEPKDRTTTTAVCIYRSLLPVAPTNDANRGAYYILLCSSQHSSYLVPYLIARSQSRLNCTAACTRYRITSAPPSRSYRIGLGFVPLRQQHNDTCTIKYQVLRSSWHVWLNSTRKHHTTPEYDDAQLLFGFLFFLTWCVRTNTQQVSTGQSGKLAEALRGWISYLRTTARSYANSRTYW